MKNFRSCSALKRQLEGRMIAFDGTLNDFKKNINHSIEIANRDITNFQKDGFIIDEEKDVFVKPGVGAYMENIDASINTPEDFRTYVDPILKTNPYEKNIVKMMDEGYQLVIGEPAGYKGKNAKGLYCSNYEKMWKKEQAAKAAGAAQPGEE